MKKLVMFLMLTGLVLFLSTETFADTLSGSNALQVQVKSDGLYFIYNGRTADGSSCSWGADYNNDGTYDSSFYISTEQTHYKEMVALILASYTMQIPLGVTYISGDAPCYVSDVLF